MAAERGRDTGGSALTLGEAGGRGHIQNKERSCVCEEGVGSLGLLGWEGTGFGGCVRARPGSPRGGWPAGGAAQRPVE